MLLEDCVPHDKVDTRIKHSGPAGSKAVEGLVELKWQVHRECVGLGPSAGHPVSGLVRWTPKGSNIGNYLGRLRLLSVQQILIRHLAN